MALDLKHFNCVETTYTDLWLALALLFCNGKLVKGVKVTLKIFSALRYKLENPNQLYVGR